jgi:hypothetical protein
MSVMFGSCWLTTLVPAGQGVALNSMHGLCRKGLAHEGAELKLHALAVEGIVCVMLCALCADCMQG